MDNLYTIAELSEYMKVSRKTIERMIASKKINAFQIGDQWRISEEEVERIKKEGAK